MSEISQTTTTTTVTSTSRSMAVAYLLWLLIGIAGGHRLYAGRKTSGFVMLGLALTCFLLVMSLIGALLAIPLYAILLIWWLIDAFRIPSWGLSRSVGVVKTETVVVKKTDAELHE